MNWKNWWKKAVAFFLILAGTLPAIGGSVDGPYVVWINLDQSNDGQRVDEIIREFTSDEANNCHGQWMNDPILYMKKRPPLVSDELIEDAFLKKNTSQIKRLNAILKSYKDKKMGGSFGLDGIVVYSHQGDAKLMSLTTGERKISTFTVALNKNAPQKSDIEAGFCAIVPSVTRAP